MGGHDQLCLGLPVHEIVQESEEGQLPLRTHGRLWLDGTDATGIVAITGRAFEASTYGGVSWAADITDNAKTVEVDLWLQAKISILNPSAPGPSDQVGWLDARPGSRLR